MLREIIIVLILLINSYAWSQTIDPNTLLNLPELSTIDRTTNISPAPKQGALAFDTDLKKIFEYNGTEWKELLEKPLGAPTVSPKTGNYTLTSTDNGNVLTFNSTTDVVLTVPTGLPVGFNVSIYQIGTGKVTITGSGTQIKNRLSRFKTAGLNAGVGLISTATNIFHLTGDLKK